MGELFQSKRFWAAVMSVLVVVLGHFGFEVDQETLWLVVSPVIAWIVGDSLRGLPSREKEVNGDDFENI